MKIRQTGFTLIELLVTLGIVVVLATWAIPSFRNTVRNNNVITCGNELITAVVLARSEAVNRAAVAGVVPVSGDFSNGWEVLIDTTASTPTVLDGDDEVARSWPACPNMNLSVETGHPGEIRFSASGRPSGIVGDLDITVTDSDCSSGEPFSRQISITNLGTAKTSKVTCT